MRPLEGKRVLVTRSLDQSGEFCAALAREGAIPVVFPTIEVHPVEDLGRLDDAIDRLAEYDWIGFTSANGVRIFWERVTARGRMGLPPGPRVAAVGPATARELASRGVRVDWVPEEHRGERLADGMGEVRGRRVLLPRAAAAREALAVALTEAGAEVHDVATYRTITARPTPEGLAELKRGVDVATFTSASTVHHFAAIVGGDPATALGGALVACIGPLTAEAARAAGLRVDIQASDYSGEGLVAALVGHFQSSPIPGAR